MQKVSAATDDNPTFVGMVSFLLCSARIRGCVCANVVECHCSDGTCGVAERGVVPWKTEGYGTNPRSAAHILWIVVRASRPWTNASLKAQIFNKRRRQWYSPTVSPDYRGNFMGPIGPLKMLFRFCCTSTLSPRIEKAIQQWPIWFYICALHGRSSNLFNKNDSGGINSLENVHSLDRSYG